MTFLRRKLFPSSAAVWVAVSLVYPGVVYVTRTVVPPLIFVALALALIGVRLGTLRSPIERVWRVPLAVAAMIIAILTLLDTLLAVKAYPAVISLAAATVF